MSDVYHADSHTRDLRRTTDAPSLWSIGTLTREHRLPLPAIVGVNAFQWGSDTPATTATALAMLANCCQEEARLRDGHTEELVSWHFKDAFASEYVIAADPEVDLRVPWLEVWRWLETHAADQVPKLSPTHEAVVRFDDDLRAAHGETAGETSVGCTPAVHWSLVDMFHAYASGSRPLDRLPRLMGYMLDLKFKLYCLLEVDVPLYSAAHRQLAMDKVEPTISPHNLLLDLSFDDTAIYKVRAIWEAVMNTVYWLETGKEIRRTTVSHTAEGAKGDRIRSKSRTFFKFVETHEMWKSLTQFRDLVAEFDDRVRTPEAHGPSSLRAAFLDPNRPTLPETRRAYNSIGRICQGFWHHLVAVIGVNVPMEWHGEDHQRI